MELGDFTKFDSTGDEAISSSTTQSHAEFRGPPAPGRLIHCAKTNAVYQLGEQIGSGAAAVVFRCRRAIDPYVPGVPPVLDMSKEYAAKVMDLRSLKLRSDFERERQKLRREVAILSTLHHPCIVNLNHVIETRDELFLIMELVGGGELFYKIIELGALSEDQTRYVLVQILHALHYMHSKNIIHRDLKPENILISQEVAHGFFRVQVADFGLAKLVQNGVSQANTFVGTPQYWAPEVIECSTSSRAYDSQADLWSLGCLIYVMLGGAYPFDSRLGQIDVLIRKAQFHFRYPRFQRVSQAAKDLIRGLLTVDPQRRFNLNEVFLHPWVSTFQVPPGVDPLPVLSPILSRNLSHRVVMSTKSVLEPSESLIGKYISPPINNLAGILPQQAGQLQVRLPGQPLIPDSTDFLPVMHFDRATDPNTRAIVRVQPHTSPPFLRDDIGVISSGNLSEYQHKDTKINTGNARYFPQTTKVQTMQGDWAIYQDRWPHDIQDPSSIAATAAAAGSTVPPAGSVEGGYNSNRSHQPTNSTARSGNIVKTAELIFNFEELLSLQISVLKKFHWAYLALRSSPLAAKGISSCIVEAREVQMESLSIIKIFEATCVSVLGLLPDLNLAVSERKMELAINLFEDIREWVMSLKSKVESHQSRVGQFIRHVGELVEAIRTVKAATDKQLTNSVARISLEPRNRVPVKKLLAPNPLVESSSGSDGAERLIISNMGVNAAQRPSCIKQNKTSPPSSRLPVVSRTPRVESVTSLVGNAATIHSLGISCVTSGHSSEDEGRSSAESEPLRSCRESDSSLGGASDQQQVLSSTDVSPYENGHNGGSVRYQEPPVASNPEFEASHATFQRWYDGVKETVFQQLESLTTEAITKIVDTSRTSELGAQSSVFHKRKLVEGFPAEQERIYREGKSSREDANMMSEIGEETPSTIAHELLDLLFMSPAAWGEKNSCWIAPKSIQDGSSKGDSRLSEENSKKNDCSSNYIQSGGSSSATGFLSREALAEEATTAFPCSPAEEALTANAFHNKSKGRWATAGQRNILEAQRQNRRRHCKETFYHQALQTSELLIRALDELRRIEQILRKSSSFWLNLTAVIERLCQMKTHAEKLLNYSSGSAAFTDRFFVRLGDYHDFWAALRDQAKQYVAESTVKLDTMDDFALTITSTADRVDTANALHLGEVGALVALQGTHQRHNNPHVN